MSVQPLLLEAASRVRIVRRLVARVVVQVAVEVEGTVLLLGEGRVAVAEVGFLVGRDAEDGVGSFLEMLVAEDLPQTEVALEGEETIAAGLVLGPDASALNKTQATPIFSEMLLSPPCLNSSSSLTMCLMS